MSGRILPNSTSSWRSNNDNDTNDTNDTNNRIKQHAWIVSIFLVLLLVDTTTATPLFQKKKPIHSSSLVNKQQQQQQQQEATLSSTTSDTITLTFEGNFSTLVPLPPLPTHSNTDTTTSATPSRPFFSIGQDTTNHNDNNSPWEDEAMEQRIHSFVQNNWKLLLKGGGNSVLTVSDTIPSNNNSKHDNNHHNDMNHHQVQDESYNPNSFSLRQQQRQRRSSPFSIFQRRPQLQVHQKSSMHVLEENTPQQQQQQQQQQQHYEHETTANSWKNRLLQNIHKHNPILPTVFKDSSQSNDKNDLQQRQVVSVSTTVPIVPGLSLETTSVIQMDCTIHPTTGLPVVEFVLLEESYEPKGTKAMVWMYNRIVNHPSLQQQPQQHIAQTNNSHDHDNNHVLASDPPPTTSSSSSSNDATSTPTMISITTPIITTTTTTSTITNPSNRLDWRSIFSRRGGDPEIHTATTTTTTTTTDTIDPKEHVDDNGHDDPIETSTTTTATTSSAMVENQSRSESLCRISFVPMQGPSPGTLSHDDSTQLSSEHPLDSSTSSSSTTTSMPLSIGLHYYGKVSVICCVPKTILTLLPWSKESVEQRIQNTIIKQLQQEALESISKIRDAWNNPSRWNLEP